MFLKNTLYVIPNPSLEYFGTEPVFNIYFEVYNALENSEDGYIVTYNFFNAINKEIVSVPRKKKSVSNAQVEYLTFPIELFPTEFIMFRLLQNTRLNLPLIQSVMLRSFIWLILRNRLNFSIFLQKVLHLKIANLLQ
jgi:hypothetical protein